MEMREALKVLKKGSEAELRDLDMPWPKTEKQLLAIVKALAARQHDYGTCVYAMSIAAEAAFNYMAHVLGVTGFQASCADLDILKRTRGLEWGKVLDYANLLYPQYLDDEHYPSADYLLHEQRNELAKRAKAMLKKQSGVAHPEIVAHWKRLAANGGSDAQGTA